MTEPRPPYGLYAITDPGLIPDARLIDTVAAAIDGGARTIQYRDQRDDPPLRRQLAAALVELCRARGVRLIVNDDVALARAVGADGVHLGLDDAALAAARAALGAQALIGVSCYDSLERAAHLEYLPLPAATQPSVTRGASQWPISTRYWDQRLFRRASSVRPTRCWCVSR